VPMSLSRAAPPCYHVGLVAVGKPKGLHYMSDGQA
jgi:hypothetical protein